MRCNFFVLLLMILSFVGCDSSKSEGRSSEQLKQIEIIQKDLMSIIENKENLDIQAGEELLDKITKYSNAYREDSMSAVFMLDGAQLCATMGKYQKAIQLLLNYSEHPKATKLDYATYLVGFEYDEHLNQPMTAEKYYRAVIERYPNSEWAIVANQSLQWLGLSDEEIIKKLESQK
jgi:outer membrane protein assembly factor BamD (BamD/ComL family)